MAWALDRIWTRLNQELFRSLGADRYSLWIQHSRPATLDEEVFAFHFANTHAKDKVESILKDAVIAAAQRTTNRNVRVHFTVEGESFPEAVEAPAPTREPCFASFVAGTGNRAALSAARSFARGGPGSARTLFIHAPSGLGRTHLLRAIHAEL